MDFQPSTFDNNTNTKNVPNYSFFGYRLSQYIFLKKLGIPKLLPESMALLSAKNLNLALVKPKSAFVKSR